MRKETLPHVVFIVGSFPKLNKNPSPASFSQRGDTPHAGSRRGSLSSEGETLSWAFLWLPDPLKECTFGFDPTQRDQQSEQRGWWHLAVFLPQNFPVLRFKCPVLLAGGPREAALHGSVAGLRISLCEREGQREGERGGEAPL